MPNRNYISGRNFEYARKREWERAGYTVIRASGSHGPYDLVSFHPSYPVIAIQCKRVKTVAEADRLGKDFQNNPPIKGGRFNQIMEVLVYGTRPSKVRTYTVLKGA